MKTPPKKVDPAVVIALVAEGKTHAEIASELGLHARSSVWRIVDRERQRAEAAARAAPSVPSVAPAPRLAPVPTSAPARGDLPPAVRWWVPCECGGILDLCRRCRRAA